MASSSDWRDEDRQPLRQTVSVWSRRKWKVLLVVVIQANTALLTMDILTAEALAFRDLTPAGTREAFLSYISLLQISSSSNSRSGKWAIWSWGHHTASKHGEKSHFSPEPNSMLRSKSPTQRVYIIPACVPFRCSCVQCAFILDFRWRTERTA